MKTKRLFMLTAFAMLMSIAGYSQEWQRLSAPIMTPWGEQIDPENVWQEYPRPQLVRPDWINLNGVWQYFRRDNTQTLTYVRSASSFKQRILVPFGVESALSGIMHTDLGTTANSTLMYRRTFELTDAFKGKRTLLHFGAVDWRCVVFVNKTKVGQHDGGNDPFTFDITDYLTESGEQELQVAVYDPSSRGGQPRGKQTTNPGSIWYTSCSGIWQTVWLEPVSSCYIERYEVVPDAESGTVKVKVLANDPTCKFYLIARDGEDIVATTEKTAVGEEVTMTIPNAKLWSPDSPFLYNLDIYLTMENCQDCDKARGYFGLRTLSKGMVDGHPAFLLNGKPLFMYGPLDQGWWPDGLLTPPSYEAMIYDLKAIKRMGMNMVRKHIKVEPDLWYEWCDRNGLIVWQDMPNGSESGSLGTKEELQHIFYEESERIVHALKQHPSICVWVPYNEGWGQDAGSGAGHTMRGYLVVRNADADPGRLMNAASGWTDFEIGDITDAHSYPTPNGQPNTRNDRVNVCGEFGGISYLIEGHLWGGNDQVYTSVEDGDVYTTRFNQYTSALQSLQISKGLWAGVYTQVTDVEKENNGFLTYDRKVWKINDEQVASIRRNIEKTIHQRLSDAVSVVSAGDNSSNISWRYTTDEPAAGWEKATFDDSSWKRGIAGFGDISQPDARVQTKWSTPEIWIRRQFKFDGLTADDLPNLCLRIFYDEDSEVYINGVLAFSITGYNTTYQLFDISDAARNAIKLDGNNVIAIHTKQTSGGQYIDAGFSLRTYKDNSELVVEPLAELNLPEFSEDSEKAYLFCYSKPGTPRMFYAYSYDGLTWNTMNEGNSVFGVTDGQPAVQRPFIRRLEDESGNVTFHLVFGGDSGASGLYHWTSNDLFTWKPLSGTDGKVFDSEAIAPEMDYDSGTKNYVYYWSIPFEDMFILKYSRTKDFETFSRVATYFSPGYSARDLTTFLVDNNYVALYTDPESRGLCSAISRSLNPQRSKFQGFKLAFSNPHIIMSPTVFPAFDGSGWFLFGTEQGDKNIYCAAKASASNIVWRMYENATCGLPKDAEGGKVTVVTRSELDRLIKLFSGIDTAVEDVRSRPNDQHVNRYNLKGIKVSEPTSKGVYIIDGRKTVVQ